MMGGFVLNGVNLIHPLIKLSNRAGGRSVSVQLLGELLLFRNCHQRGRRDAGKVEPIPSLYRSGEILSRAFTEARVRGLVTGQKIVCASRASVTAALADLGFELERSV
jgi:hypothetical protein